MQYTSVCRSSLVALVLAVLVAGIPGAHDPSSAKAQNQPSFEKRRTGVSRTGPKFGLQPSKGNAIFDIKNVDITHFPEMGLIFSAVNNRNEFIKTLRKEDVIVLENGMQRPILSLDLVSGENRVPIDIVFVIDQTASITDMIGVVKQHVNHFVEMLRQYGFDYRLGLVRFSDIIEWQSPKLTDDVAEFEKWVTDIPTVGGGDPNENALEGLHAIASMPLRPIALRLAVLITDAMCHQLGDHGDGTTDFTMQSMGDWLFERELRLLTVTPKEFPQYHDMAAQTDGASFDLGQSFDSVVTGLVTNITSLYSLRYLSQSTLAPDSVRFDLLRAEDRTTLASRKLLAMEPGRRFVFDDLQFAPNQAQLMGEFIPELERVVRLMHVRPAMRIKIEGHADSTGSQELNLRISDERAIAVKRYLMQSGIAPDRIESVGYAATRPIASNASEAGRRLNRRIEFLILSK